MPFSGTKDEDQEKWQPASDSDPDPDRDETAYFFSDWQKAAKRAMPSSISARLQA